MDPINTVVTIPGEGGRGGTSSPAGSSSGVGYFEKYVDYFSVNSVGMSRMAVGVSDVEAEGKVLKFSSVLDKSDIQEIARNYFFPENLRLVVPGPDDRACSPPVGFTTVYEDCLKFGLRFPLPLLYAELLADFGISLSQLMPNSFRHLSALCVHTIRCGFRPSLYLIRRFFQIKNSEGWFYLSPRPGFKAKTKSKVSN